MCLLQALGIGEASQRESQRSSRDDEVVEAGGRSWKNLTCDEKAEIVACVAGVVFVILISLALLSGSIFIAASLPIFWIFVFAETVGCLSICVGAVISAISCIDRIYNKSIGKKRL